MADAADLRRSYHPKRSTLFQDSALFTIAPKLRRQSGRRGTQGTQGYSGLLRGKPRHSEPSALPRCHRFDGRDVAGFPAAVPLQRDAEHCRCDATQRDATQTKAALYSGHICGGSGLPPRHICGGTGLPPARMEAQCASAPGRASASNTPGQCRAMPDQCHAAPGRASRLARRGRRGSRRAAGWAGSPLGAVRRSGLPSADRRRMTSACVRACVRLCVRSLVRPCVSAFAAPAHRRSQLVLACRAGRRATSAHFTRHIRAFHAPV
jgi:hypothetical protein